MPDDEAWEFSPEFEARLQREERKAAQEAAERESRRLRRRQTECCIPDCSTMSERRGEFPICGPHLVKIWARVDESRRMDADLLAAQEVAAARYAESIASRRDSAPVRGRIYALDTRDGLIKIGWTKDLWLRMRQYPPTFRLIASCAGTRADETAIHRALRPSKVSGREWYDVTPEVVRQVNQIIALENVALARQHQARMDEWDPSWSDAFRPAPLKLRPRFTDLDSWEGEPIGVFAADKRPGPKSRSAVRRVS